MRAIESKCWKCLTCLDQPEFETWEGISRHLRKHHDTAEWHPEKVENVEAHNGIGWYSHQQRITLAKGIVVLEDVHGSKPVKQEVEP